MVFVQLILTIGIRIISLLPIFSKRVVLPGLDANGNSTVNYTTFKRSLLGILSNKQPLMVILLICIALSAILSVLSVVMKNNRGIIAAGKIASLVLVLVFSVFIVLAVKVSPKY